jgi:hypothetical protein
MLVNENGWEVNSVLNFGREAGLNVRLFLMSSSAQADPMRLVK